MKTKTLLIWAGIGVVGYLLYKNYQANAENYQANAGVPMSSTDYSSNPIVTATENDASDVETSLGYLISAPATFGTWLGNTTANW
jgi:uncharacterized membrane protein YebE (DUF533 family)